MGFFARVGNLWNGFWALFVSDLETNNAEAVYEAAIEEARQIIRKQKFAKNGDAIVVVAGMPFGISGSTNSIRVVDI